MSPLEESNIETCAGIRTNNFLETNIPDVYACGDIAEFEDLRSARQLVVGNWMNAQMQGRTVAKTMCGERTGFDLVSSYATNVLGLEIIFIGDTGREAASTVEVRGAARDGEVAELFVRDGKVVGAVLINRNTWRAAVTDAIKNGKSPSSLL
jgi:NAD(P)H-nitrite reductase large subunit